MDLKFFLNPIDFWNLQIIEIYTPKKSKNHENLKIVEIYEFYQQNSLYKTTTTYKSYNMSNLMALFTIDMGQLI